MKRFATLSILAVAMSLTISILTGGLRGVLRFRAQGLRPGHDRLCRDRAQ